MDSYCNHIFAHISFLQSENIKNMGLPMFSTKIYAKHTIIFIMNESQFEEVTESVILTAAEYYSSYYDKKKKRRKIYPFWSCIPLALRKESIYSYVHGLRARVK